MCPPFSGLRSINADSYIFSRSRIHNKEGIMHFNQCKKSIKKFNPKFAFSKEFNMSSTSILRYQHFFT